MKKVVFYTEFYIIIIAATVIAFVASAWAISALFEYLIDVSEVVHEVYMHTQIVEYVVYGVPVSIALDVLVGMFDARYIVADIYKKM